MINRLFESFNNPVARIFVGAIALLGLVALLSAAMRDAARPAPTPEAPGADFERQTGMPHPGFQPAGASVQVEEMIKASGGDWNKLSAEEQRYVNSVTAGHGPVYIRDQARAMKRKAEEAAKANAAKPSGK